jgi:phage protein U
MAVSTKYRIITSSDAFISMRADIEFEGYSGAVTEFHPTYEGALKLDYQTSSDNKLAQIMPSRLTIAFFVESNFAAIDISEANERTVRVSLYDNSNVLVWRGWVNPASYSENYAAPPYVVTVVAECGLDSLSKIPFDLTDKPVDTKETIWTVLRDALFTDIDLPFAESVNIYDTAMDSTVADSPLLQGEIDYRSFGDEPNCQDVLMGILEPFGARMYQYMGKWVIENVQEKRSSYTVRQYNSAGVYQSNASFNPLVELDSSDANFRQFLDESGNLSTFPALSNAAVFFKSNPASTVLRGFQNASDWIDGTTLEDWTPSGISIARTPINFQGADRVTNEFAVRTTGRDTQYDPDVNYLESIGISVVANQDVEINFSHYSNWPTLLLFGSKPRFWVQFILTGAADTYYYNKNGTWQTSITAVDVQPSKRQQWYNQQLKLSNLPEDGTLKIRFSRLIKTGSDTNTELRLTAFKTNLASSDIDDTIWNLDTAFQNIFSTYRRVEFEHEITDLPNDGEIGGITVSGTPTSSWNRRGQTDNLNLRRLFLKQWLSLHSRPTGILNGNIVMRNGWQITPSNTFKDTVSSKIYCFSSYAIDFQTGVISLSSFELLTTDASPAYEIEVSVDRPGRTFRQVRNPEEERGGESGSVAGGNLNLIGDTTGDPSQNIVVASVIQNKSELDFSGNPESSTLSLNIVTNDLGAELQKTTALSLLSSWPDKATPIAADKIPILDSVTGEIRMVAADSLPIAGSKWTEVTNGIYRDGRVAIGKNTVGTTQVLDVLGNTTITGNDGLAISLVRTITASTGGRYNAGSISVLRSGGLLVNQGVGWFLREGTGTDFLAGFGATKRGTGTGDFIIECWNSGTQRLVAQHKANGGMYIGQESTGFDSSVEANGLEVKGRIKTGNFTGTTARYFKFGEVKTGSVVLDEGEYLTIEVNGVTRYVALVDLV